MKVVFADTLYWIAIIKPQDPWQKAAREARSGLGNVILLTTDEVLSEFLTMLSRGGPRLRKQAANMVKAIMENPNVRVVPQTRDSFLKGLSLYEERSDKEYSLTDCTSMSVMKAEGLARRGPYERPPF
jgi:predicted nucleic acid-binding protein